MGEWLITTMVFQILDYIHHYYQEVVYAPMCFIWDVQLKKVNYLSTFFCCSTNWILLKQIIEVVWNILAGCRIVSVETKQTIKCFERWQSKNICTSRSPYCRLLVGMFRGKWYGVINCESTTSIVQNWTLFENREH